MIIVSNIENFTIKRRNVFYVLLINFVHFVINIIKDNHYKNQCVKIVKWNLFIK